MPYSPEAVNAAIASSTRHGRKIGKREATAIHRLLAGRTPAAKPAIAHESEVEYLRRIKGDKK